mmetsp:Transcript_49062/g.128078  ORF Transcript_49062/g.128078 Transcript_49062/m.128078 type:complete len:97 (-) Transcript_49062:169-459(-)
MVNADAYREQARRQAAASAQAQTEIKRLRAVRIEMANQQKQELTEMRGALSAMQEQFRSLSLEHELLKVKLQAQNQEWKKLLAESLSSAAPTEVVG